MTPRTNPPALAELTGRWMASSELENLPSLRSPFGQGHVNADLTSLSWLALPPAVVGYHTGVLRVDGEVRTAGQYRWMPWGVQRRSDSPRLPVETDVRFATGEPAILWRTTVTNRSSVTRTVTLEQELAAMLANSEVDWGWLYGTPWNHGHYHDFFSTEKIRAQAIADVPQQTHLVSAGERRLRLGKPRVAGIQRDEDDVAMLLDTALPSHTTSDRIEPNLPGARVVVRAVELTTVDGERSSLLTTEATIEPDSEQTIAIVELNDGSMLSVEFKLVDSSTTGVIATHGNHPDSLQIGLTNGVPWISVGGEYLTTDAALGEGWHTVSVRVAKSHAELVVDDGPVLRTTPWWVSDRWTTTLDDGVLTTSDRVTGAQAHYAFATSPDSVHIDGSRGIARWDLTMAAGESRTVEFVLDLSSDTSSRARDLASAFAEEFTSVQTWWENTWQSAFTPNNSEFSGYLPLLDADPGLEKSYYTSALEAIYVRNKHSGQFGSIYLSGGPRLGPTTTFYWDVVEWARVYALLDPQSLRDWIVACLSNPYDRGMAMDCKNLLPIGNYYSANDFSLFRSVECYVGITGDTSVLDELAGGRPIIEHLREMAFRPLVKNAAFGEGILVDFGDDPWELLEAVPNYRHAVVSFNAAYVGMLRGFADLLSWSEQPAEASAARELADKLAGAVVRQYAGDGRWLISMPDHDEAIGHCLDFQHVAGEMAEDLSPTIKAEMIEFVTTKLLDGDWMVALDPDDPIAPFSDRPDHGASGAFAAWPADTADGLIRLGERAKAIEFLGGLHRSTSGALFGQAMEARGDGTYFVSERGCHCIDVATGASIADAIIRGVFGIRAGFSALREPQGELTVDGARLHNVRAIGFDLAAS